MRVELNIEKKYFLVITAALLIFSAVLMVTAYNSNWANSPGAPTTVGHSPDELVGSLKCGAGQALTITASGWSCVTFPAGGTSGTVVAGGSDGITSAIGSICSVGRDCQVLWGSGTCTFNSPAGQFNCPAGSTKRKVGEVFCTPLSGNGQDRRGNSYVCIQN